MTWHWGAFTSNHTCVGQPLLKTVLKWLGVVVGFHELEIKWYSHVRVPFIENKISFNCWNSCDRKHKMSISCFLEGIDPIFNTKFPFHVFWNLLIPYSRFLRNYENHLPHLFEHFINCRFSTCWDFQKQHFSNYEKWFGIFSWIVLNHLVSAKSKKKWFGGSWTRPKTEILKMNGFRASPKWNRKVTLPKWSRMILRSFWPYLFHKITTTITTNATKTA